MGIIFDLDQTIIDSQIAIDIRGSRLWPDVYKMIPKFTVYEGMIDLIDELNNLNIPLCIVTSSPSSYCDRVLNHHKIKINNRVCFHDTSRRKPHPDPILKGISMLNVPKDTIISIGDDPKDIIASKAAGVYSIAATWGSPSVNDLTGANAEAICNSVADLKMIIYKVLGMSTL